MSQIAIEPARAEELPEAATLLSQAMSTLPENYAVFRGRRDRLERMFRVMLGRTPGQVLIAKREGQVVGVMRMVEWPHCREAPILERLRMLAAMLWILKDTFARAMKFHSIWAGRDPGKHHWHLGPIAVLPERQGQGIGTRMLTHFCGLVDERRAAAYLETGKPENVRLYERFGFSVIGEVPVFDVPTWLMWRPAPEQEEENIL